MKNRLFKEIILKTKELQRLGKKALLDADQLSGFLGEAVASHLIIEKLEDDTYVPAPPRAESIDGSSDRGTYSVKYFSWLSKSASKIFLHKSLNFDWLVIIMSNTNYVVPRNKFTTVSQIGIATQDRIDSGIIYLTKGGKNELSIAGSDINMAILDKHYNLPNTSFLNELLYTKSVEVTPKQLEILDLI